MHDRLVSRRFDALHQCFLVIFVIINLRGRVYLAALKLIKQSLSFISLDCVDYIVFCRLIYTFKSLTKTFLYYFITSDCLLSTSFFMM